MFGWEDLASSEIVHSLLFSSNSIGRRSVFMLQGCCGGCLKATCYNSHGQALDSCEVLYLQCYKRVMGVLRSGPDGHSIEDLWLDD